MELLKSHGIGLTGGIATGKSTIARLLAGRGELVIDADQLARDVVAKGTPGLAAIVETFGREMLAPDGSLDRKRLGEHVFAAPTAKAALEAITHPRIKDALFARLAALPAPRRFFYEAALLYEVGRSSEFAKVWVAYCPREVQIARVMARDKLPRERAEQILAAQWPAEEKARRADRVIDTDGTLVEVEARVVKALQEETIR